ncbi:hypothetical protein A3730_19910 [Alcanivorax sp. HI0044]|nr:hypothetical protein A3730_19910 [Alcanivorax sp. HI0044]
MQGLPVPSAPEKDQLLMIGRRHIRSNNSWMHNSQRLIKGKGRFTAIVHPQDAQRLGVEEGADVTISGSAGSITLPASISDDIMPGVISVPHGWGHDRDGVQLEIARSTQGCSVNDVIGTERVEAVTAMAQLNGIPVTLAPAICP